jgi:hypothetical protein
MSDMAIVDLPERGAPLKHNHLTEYHVGMLVGCGLHPTRSSNRPVSTLGAIRRSGL